MDKVFSERKIMGRPGLVIGRVLVMESAVDRYRAYAVDGAQLHSGDGFETEAQAEAAIRRYERTRVR